MTSGACSTVACDGAYRLTAGLESAVGPQEGLQTLLQRFDLLTHLGQFPQQEI